MFNFNKIIDLLLGDCIRTIESAEKSIYLTFDDGPNSYCTPHVLNVLKKYNAKATFFVIGNNIYDNLEVFKRIHNENHAIGNHSPDHNTTTYFKGKKSLKTWINLGESIITEHLDKPSIGFRPPVGLRTPELRLVMKEQNEKPIMWQHRFFDTVFAFNNAAWERKFLKMKSGDIILLHDTHKQPQQFLASLEKLIQKLTANGFQLKALERR
jgi:peptidoglycan/xylan/chitin deacetylase (PgdA/CDA1 family)